MENNNQSQFQLDNTCQSEFQATQQQQVFQKKVQNQDRPLNNQNYLKSQVMDNQQPYQQFEKTQFQNTTMDIKEITQFQQIPVQKLEESEEEEYLEEDFEEYYSDEEEDNNANDTRLTSKATDNDLKNVVDLYKSEIENNKHNNLHTVSPLEDIKETTLEYKPMTPQISQHNKQVQQNYQMGLGDRVQNLKNDGIKKIGEQNFNEMYQVMKNLRQEDKPDEIIQQIITRQFGKKLLQQCLLIDQIIFLESQNQ